jgi:hypothetical protein
MCKATVMFVCPLHPVPEQGTSCTGEISYCVKLCKSFGLIFLELKHAYELILRTQNDCISCLFSVFMRINLRLLTGAF